MMNALTFNTAMLNAGTPLPAAVTAADYDMIEFNGYSLQNADVISSVVDAFSTPSRELVTFKIPRADGLGWNGNYFRERRIKVSGIIEKTTSALLEAELDSFKRYMCAPEAYLYHKIGTEVRKIVANLEKPEEMFSRREGYHITFTPFDLTFLAVEPMWHGLDYTTHAYEDVATLSYPDSIEISGTYKAQPVIVVIFQAVSSVTAFDFTNSTNDDQITFSQTFAAGDVLIIDSENKSATLNGTEIDYTGVFPELSVGVNEFTFTVTGTSVEYTATIKYRKTYL